MTKFFTGGGFHGPAELTFGQRVRHTIERMYGFAFRFHGKEYFIGVWRSRRTAG
jgi:hypothetical protein